jgi:nicotinate dehydrogenase subunit A
MTQKFILNVNGKAHTVDADPDMPLLYALRNDVGLNSPHFGCGLAQCGACTVHLDGEPIRCDCQRDLRRYWRAHTPRAFLAKSG